MNWTAWDWLRYVLNFAVVIAVMVGCLWLLKRMQGKQFSLTRKNTNRMQIVETLSIGPRQKLMLVSIDGRELLIGATAQQITTLGNAPARFDAQA
jgi:flagellar protein FliO/FliZ